jgi:hypothetical protein
MISNLKGCIHRRKILHTLSGDVSVSLVVPVIGSRHEYASALYRLGKHAMSDARQGLSVVGPDSSTSMVTTLHCLQIRGHVLP